MRIVRRLRFREQACALDVGLEHDLDQAFRSARRLLREPADAPARRDCDVALFGAEVARDHVEQRRLAGSVAADEADARAGGMRAEALSISVRPAMRTVRSSRMSIRAAFWPTRLFDAMACC